MLRVLAIVWFGGVMAFGLWLLLSGRWKDDVLEVRRWWKRG